MTRSRTIPFLAFVGLLLALLACAGAAFAARDARPGDPCCRDTAGAALRARYESLHPEAHVRDFGRPLQVLSREGDARLEGEVYGLVHHPFRGAEQALRDPRQWCEVMMLPFNSKGCIAGTAGEPTALTLYLGKKKDSTPDDSYRVRFDYRVEALGPDFMRIALRAAEGPLGTHDFRIALEAAPMDEAHTVIHLSYAYGFGAMSRLAMQAYLSTIGAPKVGFTVEGRDGEGHPEYVHGMRGVVERNTMRYFLAIEAYLATLAYPDRERLERRLLAWFDETERFPRQLHEMDRDEYLAMKRREYRQLQASL